MTEPLTPADCDLQDFPFMPLHVARLRDSDLASEASPEACWYAVLLWAASWHQLPAGSLPDNETVLTKLIGLGRDVRTFRKHRDGAMRGFVKCSDGRLYHPVVAEQVLEAWERKRQQRWRSEMARIKKANQRNGTNIPAPTYEQFLAGVSPENVGPGPQPVPEDTQDCPSGHWVQETGTGTETGTPKKEAIASSVAATPTTAKPKAVKRSYSEAFEAAWGAYPHHQGRSSKPNSQAAFDRLPADEQSGLVAAIGRFAPNVGEVCGGKGAPDMAVWLKDGKHLNWQVGVTSALPTASWSGPPAVRESIVRAKDEDFARKWIDPYCQWSPLDRTLLVANAYAAKQITQELPGWFTANRAHIAVAPANDTPPLLAIGAAA